MRTISRAAAWIAQKARNTTQKVRDNLVILAGPDEDDEP